MQIDIGNYHGKTSKDLDELYSYWVYVGRPNKYKGELGSPLQNPYYKNSREQNIADYRKWLWGKINQNDKTVMDELSKILTILEEHKQVTLVCWCYPEKCHVDVIKACLLWMLDKLK